MVVRVVRVVKVVKLVAVVFACDRDAHQKGQRTSAGDARTMARYTVTRTNEALAHSKTAGKVARDAPWSREGGNLY